MKISELQTGDILLYCPSSSKSGIISFVERMIKWTTHSNISHCGFILRDPTFIHPSLKGVYLWESSLEGIRDVQDNKIKFGVQIVPLQDVLSTAQNIGDRIFIRKLKHVTKDTFNNTIMTNIHDVVYNKPYDFIPRHLLDVILKRNNDPQHVSRFICSALVGYIYTMCKILHRDTNWSILVPNDFTPESDTLLYNSDIVLEDSIHLLEN